MNATQTLTGKALKAMGALFSITSDLEVPVKIMLNLFDAYVSSILNYACEVWGFCQAENIERVHRKFLKSILGVKISTNNSAIYGELGRYPLYLIRYVRIIKYYLKLYSEQNSNCILQTMIRTMRQDINRDQNCQNWASSVRDLLQNSGFNDVWLYPESVNSNIFIPVLRNRLIDIYIGTWRNDINSRNSLVMYREIKHNFELSAYIENIQEFKLRQVLAKLRLSSHNLNIESGRHRNIPRDDRKCTICTKNDLEDEYHFVLICTAFSDHRKKFIPKYYYDYPSMFKFIQLLSSTNTKLLTKLAIYCNKAFKIRLELLNNVL